MPDFPFPKSTPQIKAKVISFAPDVPFKDIHPIPGKRRSGPLGGKDLPPWGGSEGDESGWVRCKHCGYPNYIRETPPGSGWGNITFTDTSNANKKDPVVGAGCRFCGSSNYGDKSGSYA